MLGPLLLSSKTRSQWRLNLYYQNVTCELWFICIQTQFDSRPSEVKVLLCCSNGQDHSGGLEFDWMFVNPIFSVPLTFLQPNYTCWCTATNIKPDIVKTNWSFILYTDDARGLQYIGTQWDIWLRKWHALLGICAIGSCVHMFYLKV